MTFHIVKVRSPANLFVCTNHAFRDFLDRRRCCCSLNGLFHLRDFHDLLFMSSAWDYQNLRSGIRSLPSASRGHRSTGGPRRAGQGDLKVKLWASHEAI